MSYDKIIEILVKETGKSNEEIESLVSNKIDKLAGLVSKQGAALIIAHELNVDVEKEFQEHLKINDIAAGMENIGIKAKVTYVSEVNNFEKNSNGTVYEGRVASIRIGDESGSIRVVFWNDMVDLFNQKSFKVDNVYEFKNLRSKESNYNSVELVAQTNTMIKKLDEDIQVKTLQRNEIKKIYELENEELDPENPFKTVHGFITSIYDLRSFEVCPECRKRIHKKEDGLFHCLTHGKVEPKNSYFITGFIDDSTGQIRVTFFNNSIENLFGMTIEEIVENRDNLRELVMGKFVSVGGRVVKNREYNRTEMVVSYISEINLDYEIKRYEKLLSEN